jgi:type I restriction enzyme R subunit
LAVRDLINQMTSNRDPNYCVRVTANDGEEGERFLRVFQDNEKTIPTILTTSQKLSTGIDARNIRNIVLMRPINSMIEFKQIIGRGTRLFDGKDHFTIYDFVKAYQHFSDPEWDGEPVEPEAPTPRPPPSDPDPNDAPPREPSPRPERVRIKLADGKERTIQHMSSTSFWGPDGTPISAQQFLERLFGDLPSLFASEQELRTIWSRPDTRRALLLGLEEKGHSVAQLAEVAKIIDAEHSDLFDVLAYIAFALPAISREERVSTRKGLIFARYAGKQAEFLDFVLDHYVKQGVTELDDEKLPTLLVLKYHAVEDAVRQLGGAPAIREAFVGFQQLLYQPDGAA